MKGILITDKVIELCEGRTEFFNNQLMKKLDEIKKLLPERYHYIVLDVEEIYFEKSKKVMEIAYKEGGERP